MQRSLGSLGLIAVVALAACHKQPATETTSDTKVAAPPATPAAASVPKTPPAAFSLDAVPLSNAPLGAFPYFGLPPHYVPQNTPVTRAYGRFPFWTGAAFRQVEGQAYLVTIVGDKDGAYSQVELENNLHALFAAAGAVKVASGQIPSEMLAALPSAERLDVNDGFGDPYNNPVETWVIHRPDKAIWVHFAPGQFTAGLSVVETKPFVVTAALLPADALRTALAATGKAVIHVNFATDQAAILPESRPQLDAVIALLKGDPALRLAVNGYTDETGGEAHNLALSDTRAKAVMAALVGAGIDAGRLQAKGYGTANPVATNGDAAGKAANRRVELIKL